MIKLLFYLVVISHHIGLWIISLSVPLLIFKEPPWISLPLCAWIMHLTFNRLECPYTKLENSLRKKKPNTILPQKIGNMVKSLRRKLS